MIVTKIPKPPRKSESENLKLELEQTKIDLEQERLKNSKNKHSSICSLILEGHKDIIMFALDCNFNYISFNKGHSEAMKKFWDANIKIGDNMLSFLSLKSEQEKAKALFNRALSGETFTIIEDYSGDSEKALFWELNHSPILNDEKTIIGLSVLLTDKTEFIENQRVLTNTRSQLQLEIKTKNKFFSIISHDLKNALYGNLLISKSLSEHDQLSKKEKSTSIDKLYKCSRSTYTMLQNLLTWAKSQRGSITINKEILNLNNIISDAIEPYSASAQNKKLNIEINIDEDVLIFADKYTIKNVIGNLFTNAVKFTPNNGLIKITSTKQNDIFEFQIKDSGVGISEDKIKKLFRIDENNSTLGTNDEEGTGLGLVLCKEFVEKNGGEIFTTSAINKGSTFSFTLPILNA
tara:strand:+ start:532 stop:1749 length:1218 start_codon:yes stop_codon:yes gene_type:complete